MYKINYRNPMARTYQYEYAFFMLAADLFAATSCKSMVITNLYLYYKDLVKTNTNGNPSYERQYESAVLR